MVIEKGPLGANPPNRVVLGWLEFQIDSYEVAATRRPLKFVGSLHANTPKDSDQEKRDDVLRRLLKTPPDPKTGKGEKTKGKLDDAKRSERVSKKD